MIADPPAVKIQGWGCAFTEYRPPLTRVRRRELFPKPGLADPLGTCIYIEPQGVPAPSKDVFNGVFAEVRQ